MSATISFGGRPLDPNKVKAFEELVRQDASLNAEAILRTNRGNDLGGYYIDERTQQLWDFFVRGIKFGRDNP